MGKKYNLKEMSKTLIFLQEKKIGSIEEMQERVDAATARYHELGDSIKAKEARMAEISVCGRTSSTMRKRARYMMPTARPDTASDFWKPSRRDHTAQGSKGGFR